MLLRALTLVFLSLTAAAVETVSFRHLDSRDGLPQSTAPAIVQDKAGYIWIATFDGLHRYDGYSFVSYRNDPRDNNSISDNVIDSLLIDHQDLIWIGTAQGGLNRLDPRSGKLKRYLDDDGDFALRSRRISALLQASDQRVWIGTAQGLAVYLPEQDGFDLYANNPLDDDSAPYGAITALAESHDGKLWLGTARGLSQFDPVNEQFKHWKIDRPGNSNMPTQIQALWVDGDGGLWIGTAQRGLFYLAVDGKEFRVFRHDPHDNNSLPHNNVKAIRRDRGGHLWVGTEGSGLARMNADASGFASFRRNSSDTHSLSIDDVWSLFEDRSGLLWVGTAGGGINTTHPEYTGIGRITHSPYEPNSLSESFVWGISGDTQGHLWVATTRGLDEVDPASGEIFHYANFPNNDRVTITPRPHAIYADKKNRIWFGTVDGLLAVYDPQKLRAEVISHPSRVRGRFSDNRILMINGDSGGRVWVSTFESLVEVDPIKLEVVRSYPTGEAQMPGTSVRVMIESDNRLWFGTHGSGLHRYEPNTRENMNYFHRADDAGSLSNDVVRALYVDAKGAMWIGTMNGLNRWTQENRRGGVEQFDAWFARDGLPNSTIYGILPGDNGKLWLSTNVGISEFDPEKNRFRNFDWSDGLPANEYNGLSQAQTGDGRLWFGGTTGLAVIDPKKLLHAPASSATLITSVQVRNFADGYENDQQHLRLASDQNDVAFHFAAADFRDPKKNRFSYRLIGHRAEWTDLGASNSVSFTNLNPGHYTLQVRNANSDGVMAETPAEMRLLIRAPWFATWWAYSAYALMLLAAAYLLWRSHHRKLAEQEKINERLRRIDRLKDEFLANTSHELRTPLNGIIGVAESLRDGVAGVMNDRARDHLGLIAESGRRLAHLVNEILDFKKLTHHNVTLERAAVDVQATVNVVLALSRPLTGDKDLMLVNAIPTDFPPVDADENRLEQILHNLIGNAIKFTETGHVTITARVQDKTAEITVADSGCGIADEQMQRIFLPFEQVEDSMTRHHGGTGLGLAVVKKLVELHGGQVNVKSQPQQGSQFMFTLPLAASTEIVRKPKERSVPAARLLPLRRAASIEMAATTPILVADDEPLNCQVVADCLSMQGYSVVTVADGQAALDAMQTQTFALLILDVMMPKLSGFDVTRRVRENFTSQEMPVLLLSAKNRPEDVATGLSAGANDYIGKPVERSELIARVKNLLALHEVNAAKREREQAKVMQDAITRLSRYFPPALVKRLLADPDPKQLQAERRRVTVVFADLVEFTSLTDRFEPEIITDLLNQFVGGMGDLIEKFGGTLNELLGDGMVILFGAPEKMDKDEQAKHAVALSLAMQREMLKLKKSWLDAGIDHNIDLRIGIHQDFATVGNFGAGNVLAYRAVGSGVNLAARLQSLCTPGHVMVSYPVFALTRELYVFQELQEVQIKGFKHPHRVCELSPEAMPEPSLQVISNDPKKFS